MKKILITIICILSAIIIVLSGIMISKIKNKNNNSKPYYGSSSSASPSIQPNTNLSSSHEFGTTANLSEVGTWTKTQDSLIATAVDVFIAKTYVKNLTTQNLYLQSDLTHLERLNGDNYPKIGLCIADEDSELFFHIDSISEDVSYKPFGTNNFVGYACKNINDYTYNWTNSQYTQVDNLDYTGNKSVNMAILYDGTTIYLIANDFIAFTLNAQTVGITGNASVGFCGLNFSFSAENIKTSSNIDAINNQKTRLGITN